MSKKPYDFPRARAGLDRISVIVKPSTPRDRLDVFLTTAFEGYSRSFLQEFIRQGNVLVNGRTVRPSHRIQPGEEVAVILPEGAPMVPEDIPLQVIFEDNLLVAVSKQPGLVMHPARGHLSGTLLNGLLHRYADFMERQDFHLGALHRLDADTSGVVLWAREAEAHTYVARQFERRKVKKSYLAIVHGRPAEDEFEVDAALGYDPVDRRKIIVDGLHAKTARTRFRVLADGECGEVLSLVKAMPMTGRTHQIRVHLASTGHPVTGDVIYGGRRENEAGEIIGRQALHSERLGFTHPGNKQWTEVRAPLYDDVAALLQRSGIEVTTGTEESQ